MIDGHAIRRLRHALGWTQARLARKAMLSQRQLSYLESGQRGRRLRPAVLRRLADALGVRTDFLEHYDRSGLYQTADGAE